MISINQPLFTGSPVLVSVMSLVNTADTKETDRSLEGEAVNSPLNESPVVLKEFKNSI